jgi:hypothetical protein
MSAAAVTGFRHDGIAAAVSSWLQLVIVQNQRSKTIHRCMRGEMILLPCVTIVCGVLR